MKKHAKEWIILLLQLLLFYIYPLYALSIDPMGAVFIMLFVTLALSVVLGLVSCSGLKWAYPGAAAVLFLPTVPIYYNSSALVHALWYLVISAVGLALGSSIGALVRQLRKKK